MPSDRQIVVESFLDELGDFRVCVLSPFGSRVHAPWAIAAMQMHRTRLDTETQAVWFDDGIVFRFGRAKAPTLSLLVPDELELDELLQNGLASSPLFATYFRESAARALLLPRRAPGRRMPLWAQRKRGADLLRATAGFPEFPILLETLRECLSDVFDVGGLREVLGALRRGEIRTTLVETAAPSPFSASLLFNYVGNFIYAGDAPLAERRAQALTVNQSQLRELLGELELRHLLDPDAIVEVEREVRRRTWTLRGPDDVHDLLATVGELDDHELTHWNRDGADAPAVQAWLSELEEQRRVLRVRLPSNRGAGGTYYIAAEDARRYRALVELQLPSVFPPEFIEPVPDPIGDLVARYSRTHGPFPASSLTRTYPLAEALVLEKLRALEQQGRVVSGYFLPGGTGLEWCDLEVLRRIKQRSLVRLRARVQPVGPEVYARFLIEWQGAAQPRRGIDVLPSVVEQLQGAPLLASVLESEVLPARVLEYRASELDSLISSGEFVWLGLEPVGPSDGRIAIYPREELATLTSPRTAAPGELAEAIRLQLRDRGASFFEELLGGTGAFGPELLEALWALVWSGEVTNDSLAPLRSRLQSAHPPMRRRPERFRSRRQRLPGSEGRWALLERGRIGSAPTATERLVAITRTLLGRYGVLPSEAFAQEPFANFGEVYPVLKELEQAGKVRRGYFVQGLAATQFAEPGADDRLRILRDRSAAPVPLVLAATDPANPYGSLLPWPEAATRPQRAAQARVVIHDGTLVAYLSRTGHSLQTFLPEDDEARAVVERVIATALKQLVDGLRQRSIELKEIDGERAREARFGRALAEAGFTATTDGYFYVAGTAA